MYVSNYLASIGPSNFLALNGSLVLSTKVGSSPIGIVGNLLGTIISTTFLVSLGLHTSTKYNYL